MLAIITGTIRPTGQMRQLKLRDESERLKQYEESIRFFLESGAFTKLVFCENSNYGTEKLSYLTDIARKKGTELELLSFQGDNEKACLYGKGYGEGEILSHVFTQSRLVLGEPFFIKVTGRLRVENIKDIVARIKQDNIYFNIPNRTRRDIYDTRMYGMPAALFKELFLNAYPKVRDDEGRILEKVYTRVLLENNIKVTNFPRYPRIVGVSGTGGLVYGYTEWKCRLRDLFSQINIYRVKKNAFFNHNSML